MMVHLQNHHKTEFEEVTKKIVQEKKKATTSSGATVQPGQRTIEHSFELTSPILKSSAGKP